MTVGKYGKTIVAILAAGVAAVVAATTDDYFSSTEWVQVILAVLGAAGVYVVPNKKDAPSVK